MRAFIESTFACTIIAWNEWDGEFASFTVIQAGRVIVADSIELLMLELAPPALYQLAA